MLFEWDENKNRTNRAKHWIDFDFAREAFGDPFAITIPGSRRRWRATIPVDRRGLYEDYPGGIYSPCEIPSWRDRGRAGHSSDLREKSDSGGKETL
jgi:ribonuclease toxin BrnT of type II toxin-antitoxin system